MDSSSTPSTPSQPDRRSDESLDSPLIESIELERLQIGHEIHDALLPIVFGAKLSLDGYVGGLEASHPDRERLEQVVDWLGQAMEVGRRILVQTYPPELEKTAWTVAAKHTISALAPEQTQVEWQIGEECYDWNRGVASVAYRVIVEAARNAISHGKAQRIHIAADRQSVVIEDNGCGFDPDSVDASRFGIRSMRGRAKLIGADLRLDSSPEGTKITLLLSENAG